MLSEDEQKDLFREEEALRDEKGRFKAHADKMRDDDLKIPENWTFKNQSVAKNFNAHVREQLPWYDMATFVIKHYVRAYTPKQGRIYDLGCATGNMELSLDSLIEDRNVDFHAIDESEQMLSLYQGKSTPVKCDLASFIPLRFDVAICNLVLMFMRREDRWQLLRRLTDSMSDHGCVIVFEKFQPVNGYVGTVTSKLAMAMKLEKGLDSNEILTKELSVLGSQVPLNENELNGLHYTDIFRVGDFRGILITKKERDVTINL